MLTRARILPRPRSNEYICRECVRHMKTEAKPRNRLSRHFVPTSKEVIDLEAGSPPSHQMMLKAGLVRQSSAGIYSVLPFGLRILEKLERIIDREMQFIGASRLSLPSLQTSTAWEKTQRWTTSGSELFKLKDRRKGDMCLAPTHEEEITQLVAHDVSSYRQLPIRLYQIDRKYRDEKRPRGGLLRGREFMMKDLYSFDASAEAAIETYEEVRAAYRRIFEAIGVEFVEAEADSGNIGGKRSHEYHYLTSDGEDTVLSCNKCGYTANEERAEGRLQGSTSDIAEAYFRDVVSEDCFVLKYDASRTVNSTKVPKTWEAIEASQVQGEAAVLYDQSIGEGTTIDDVSIIRADYTMRREGDLCPNDENTLSAKRAIEIGHTFFLGTRYSSLLNGTFDAESGEREPFQMGCYGIGVTRLIAAIASKRIRKDGIAWPESIAPYRLCIIGNNTATTHHVYDCVEKVLGLDLIWDDRDPKRFTMGYKMRDAILQGYPYVVVLGKRFEETGKVEVWCPYEGDKERDKQMMELEELEGRFRNEE